MLAGQETTSNTLSWAFLELAKQPHIQTRLREEIHAIERMIRERGDTDFTVADFEAMPYLQAVLKEILRFYPAVPHLFRQSLHDDVLPLSKPLRTKSGKVITEVPIRAGLRVVLSVCAYNRCVPLPLPRSVSTNVAVRLKGERHMGRRCTYLQPRAVAASNQGQARHIGRGLFEPVRHLTPVTAKSWSPRSPLVIASD